MPTADWPCGRQQRPPWKRLGKPCVRHHRCTLARRALQEKGLWQTLQAQLVYGGSVAQVNHYIQTKAVQAALTAHTSSHQLEATGFWLLPTYELPQAMLLIQPTGRSVAPAAHAFYAFLQSQEAQAIWQNFGYRVLER